MIFAIAAISAGTFGIVQKLSVEQMTQMADSRVTAFEAGEGDNANIPPGHVADAEANWGTTLDVSILGSYHYIINDREAADRWRGELEAAPGDLCGNRP